jgi:DNA repair exonuclease SbcCD ATPase subunit
VRILSLAIDGFGPLRGRWEFHPDRFTLLVDDNERGKSSLLAAIVAGLYGLDGDKRAHRVVTPLERWRPWAGGPFRIELEVDAGNERYSIRRDFEAGTVQVMTSRGKDVSEEFRAGKDEFQVGQKLLGLDALEFEKCALVRQGELEQVVPGDEKARRASTLHARLENAADTNVGDTNATEAIQVLEGALRRYTCAELETTGTVEHAIKALDAKLGLVKTEIAALEHDYANIAGPVDQLAALAEEERQSREGLTRLDDERRSTMGADVKRKLSENQAQQAELVKLRDEARSLESAAHLPANAEAELRETVARHEEALRNLETLDARRKEGQQRERGQLEAEGESLKAYGACGIAEADRLIALAAEIRRLGDEEQRLKSEAFSSRDTLAGKGYEPERITFLTDRFGSLPEHEQKLLRDQASLALAFQTDVAKLEQARTESTETLRAVDSQRGKQRMPGWVLVGLGLSGAAIGAVILVLHGPAETGMMMLAGGALAALGGALMLGAAAGARKTDHEDALRRLSEAQRRLNQLRSQRAETEAALGEISRRFSYRDPVELMKEWSDYARLAEEFGPMLRPAERMETLHGQRRKVLDEVRRLLEQLGGGQPDPGHLEIVASGIRRLQAIRQRLAELERSWSWIDEEKRVAEALANGLKERALALLRNAGLSYDPARSWADHFADLAARTQDRTRHGVLTEELIPQAQGRLLRDIEVKALRAQLELIESEHEAGGAPGGTKGGASAPVAATGGKPAAGRSPIEIEKERDRLHAQREQIERKRSDLRLRIEETSRRYHAEHPEKQAEAQRLERALAHARRFKQAVELARDTIQKVALDTHRRWAEHLNQRVTELLKSVGTRVVEMRFGEDLDFSVRFWNGEPVVRGRAVASLSCGARDQLHFAVRLAIAEYLSRGPVPLPLLIDDAFATSDDERTRAGMKLLLEHFSKRHQILMATCHRKRYEALVALDPDLYRERVQMIDLRPADVAR